VLLDEHVSASFLVGAAPVLAGIALASACASLARLFAACKTRRDKQGRVVP
jgi:hypothetical protein